MNAKSQKPAVSRYKLTASLILGGLAGAAAGAATAASVEGDAPAISVTYDAAKLANDAAVHALYARIVAASQDVCPVLSQGRRWAATSATIECRKQAIERAVRQVNNPRLAALLVAHSKDG